MDMALLSSSGYVDASREKEHFLPVACLAICDAQLINRETETDSDF